MDKIPKTLDKAMDKSVASSNHVGSGISIRNGPVEMMDIDGCEGGDAKTNGVVSSKRKARHSVTNGKSYKDASSDNDEDDEPLVRS